MKKPYQGVLKKNQYIFKEWLCESVERKARIYLEIRRLL